MPGLISALNGALRTNSEIEQKLRTWERQTWLSVREIGINAWKIVKKQIIDVMVKPVTYAEYGKPPTFVPNFMTSVWKNEPRDAKLFVLLNGP